MIITLSEERNEKLLCEWSGEITDKHAQDFCDVCNKVFSVHFDLDYMHRKYDTNFYGDSFIVTAYKDEKPVAAWGVWRNDIDGRPAFQLCDFASVPSARKSGYIVDMLYCIYDEIGGRYPDALIYGFPNNKSLPVMQAAGWAVSKIYQHVYHGRTEDFMQNMPYISDNYVESFALRKRNANILRVKDKCYLVLKCRFADVILGGQIMGEISSKYKSALKPVSRVRLLSYFSAKPGIFWRKQPVYFVTYDLALTKQVIRSVPPLYKADGYSLDFNAAPQP